MERNRVVPKSDHLLYTKCAQVGRGRVGDTSVHRWGGAGWGTQVCTGGEGQGGGHECAQVGRGRVGDTASSCDLV